MTETRVCRLCKRQLPAEAYQFHRARPGEKAYRRHACKDCLRLRRDLRRHEPEAGKRRVCKRCHQDKPLSAYYRNGGGYHARLCKACHNELSKQYKLRKLATDPTYLERCRATSRNYQCRKRDEAMRATLERVNAAATETLREPNGSAKMMSAIPADSKPQKTHPRTACNGTEGANQYAQRRCERG